MKTGDVVKFANETPEEAEARKNGTVIMKVLWVDGGRVMIAADIGHMINPTSIHNLNELEIV
jgi:hypothetical protein